MVLVAEAHARRASARPLGARPPAPRRSPAAAADDGAGRDFGASTALRRRRWRWSIRGERRQVIGLLSEAHALRRYSDASERQRLGNCSANDVALPIARRARDQFVVVQCRSRSQSDGTCRFVFGNRPGHGSKPGRQIVSTRSKSLLILSSVLRSSSIQLFAVRHFLCHCRLPLNRASSCLGKSQAAAMVPNISLFPPLR